METPQYPQPETQNTGQLTLDQELDMITAFEGLPDTQKDLVHKRVVNLYYGADSISSETAIAQAMGEFYTDRLPDGYLPMELKNPLEK